MYSTERMALTGSDAIHVATVLEDCVDQLSVLGKIMPPSHEGRPEAYSVSIIKIVKTLAQNLNFF